MKKNIRNLLLVVGLVIIIIALVVWLIKKKFPHVLAGAAVSYISKGDLMYILFVVNMNARTVVNIDPDRKCLVNLYGGLTNDCSKFKNNSTLSNNLRWQDRLFLTGADQNCGWLITFCQLEFLTPAPGFIPSDSTYVRYGDKFNLTDKNGNYAANDGNGNIITTTNQLKAAVFQFQKSS